MIRYEFGAHWFTTIAGSHVAFCLCCTQTGVPESNSWYFLSGLLVLPCLLMSPGRSGAFPMHQVHWAIGVSSFPLECAVSSIAMMMQCCLTGVWPCSQTNLKSMGFPSFPALSINFLATPTILAMNLLDLG